ncbi:MAG: response regulator [Sphingomonas sp.]|uniref:hybrid sensor histidine kinase/response regulator n=1 Tax=Sphingomonas sp. TaxID=28214 RepID=UPI001ACFD10B|nr:PAS domain-containing sensor histidine kinase [Sphingomonas sp.]MBN8809579.1 response regulator [Sphingomonas sp.]
MADTAGETLSTDLRFLAGGGEATRLILARDWRDHPLGPPPGWPPALKTALSLILNSPESMILSWGRDDLVFFFNETYIPLLGPRVAWAMGAPFTEVWADAWDQAKPIIDKAFAGEIQRFTDLPWKLDTDRGAADTWWSFSYSRVLDAWGGVDGLFIFTNETTGRVLADKALIDSRDALATLNATLERRVEERTAERDRMWNTSPDLMVEATLDGVYQRANPAWRTILGYEPDEVVGRDAAYFTHPDDMATMRSGLELAQSETLPSLDLRFRCKSGGYRWVQWVAAPSATQIFAIGRDVTAAVEGKALLRQTEDQLRQAQKMEAVGQLTGGIAHDFNNMLTGIIGSLELLDRRLGDDRDPRIDRYIDAATTSAQRAAALTHRLLAFSRRQSLDVGAADVNALAAGIEDLLRRTMGESVALELSLATGLWFASTDRNQLESALLNLAINARDAMPQGGTLTIATANRRLDAEAAVQFEGIVPGDYVSVTVTDTGTGMPPEVVARAFDPFFTTKPIGVGTGLGLSMIYGFVHQTGGHVRVVSREGEGASFELLLPRFQGALPDATKREGVAVIAARPGAHVLVVEDDPAVRMLVTDVLADMGLDVHVAHDGAEAIAVAGSLDHIDLLVSDIGLPGMDGREIARRLREERPGLKTLFVSGYAEQAIDRGDFLAPGMDLIAKPFEIEAFAAKVGEMLD